MKTQPFIRRAILAAAVCGACASARADVPARVELANGTVIEARLRWMPASKRYVIIRPAPGGGPAVEQQVQPSQIVRKQVAPPAGWRELVQQAAQSPDAAIPRLLRLVDEYKMLEYDEQAASILGTLYLQRGRAEDFIKVAEKVIQDNPGAATTSVMAPLYWEALIATGKTAGGQLNTMLTTAVASAPRPIAAKALIARGDIHTRENRHRDALKDGYLRVALLFTQERDANAEALYKASKAFDALNQVTYAERMRQTLLTRHRTSEYATKLRGD